MPYFKALALQNLGQAAQASQNLEKLLAAARAEFDNPDFSEVPNSQPFSQDSEKLKRVQQLYLIGLAQLGLGQTDLAQGTFLEVLALDPYHHLIQ